MKRTLILLYIACVSWGIAHAQTPVTPADSLVNTLQKSKEVFSGSSTDSLNVEKPKSEHSHKEPLALTYDTWYRSWKIDKRTGSRYEAPMDTAIYNYQQTTLGDGYSPAMGYLGYVGSPTYSKLFFDRKEKNQFVFYDAYYPYNKDPDNRVFHNMRVPYSRLNYQSGGSGQRREERFTALLGSNFGKSLNVGLEFDYIYSHGFYHSQSTKHLDWSLFGNYLSDRFEAHAFASTAGITQFENGGLKDETYITDPNSIQGRFTTLDIPTYFDNTWNRLSTSQVYASLQYNLGYHKETADKKKKGDFVPVASLIYTTHYKEQYRRFLTKNTTIADSQNNLTDVDVVYPKRYYKEAADDSTRYSSYTNTVALSLREGFKKWVKFGLTGFLEHEYRKFSMLDTINDKRLMHKEQALIIGGILNKQQGENLRFNFQADLGIAGYNLGETRLMGNITTGFAIAGKRTELSADAYVKNLKPKYLENNYQSKYFWWNHNFGDIRRVYIGGKLSIPFTHTELKVGVENLQNYIYLNADKLPVQQSENIQVLSARIHQGIHLGVFNWDNDVVYQTSTNDLAVPLPKLSVYSNMYLYTKIVNELDFQLGIDAHFHTKYFAPGYEPALLQFYNQREKQIGNFPISTIYANMHLKQTRFFVMLYNVAPLVMNPDYFTVPHYPVNPMMFKLGVSVNLHN